MPLPTLVFGILLSSLYGALFHLIRGGSLRRLLLFLVLSWAGFWLGDLLGWSLGWNFASVGVLNAGMGTVVSLALLLIGDLVLRLRSAPTE